MKGKAHKTKRKMIISLPSFDRQVRLLHQHEPVSRHPIKYFQRHNIHFTISGPISRIFQYLIVKKQTKIPQQGKNFETGELGETSELPTGSEARC